MAKLLSVSSKWIGSGSQLRASGTASWSPTSSSQASLVLGSLALDVANLVGEAEVFTLHPLFPRSESVASAIHHRFPLLRFGNGLH
jgi:hypothetical protein